MRSDSPLQAGKNRCGDQCHADAEAGIAVKKPNLCRKDLMLRGVPESERRLSG
jgi:hypothetical protein